MRERIKTLKILCLFIFVFALAASKNVNDSDRARNIYQLFTEANPRLQPKDAKNYAEIILQAGKKYKIDPYVIAALIVNESTVERTAKSRGGDYGLMQVRWKVHEKAIKKQFPKVKSAKDMFDPKINIFYGTDILAYCMKKAKNSVRGGILRYSAGNAELADRVISIVNRLNKKGK